MPDPELPPVLILTGAPGSGKTTVARRVAAKWPRAVHLEIDSFFHFIESGYIPPWKPESHEQNAVVMGVVGDAAARYAEAGYFTILDGIVIPGIFLEPLRDSLHARGHTVALVVLRASLATCLERAASRASIPLTETAVVERMWGVFADLGALEGHALDCDGWTGQTVADTVAQRLPVSVLD